MNVSASADKPARRAREETVTVIGFGRRLAASLIDGIFSIIGILLKNTNTHWGWLLARGILGILAGLVVLNHPLWASILVPTTLVIILGIWGLLMGVISLVQAFQGDGWRAGILGALGIIFGLALIFNPVVGAVTLPWVIGIFGLIGGVMLIFLSFRIRSAA